ncbi:MAG: sigma 54-interacting transcriptional regulator [Peptococcaceae bacterium]|nr:sigma 54-interacting transcriptional regulator [Peptococcaceae bacterium]
MARKIRLGVFSPYPEFTELAGEIVREFDNAEIIVEEKILDDAVEAARDWAERDLVEAVVARNPTAQMVAGRVDLPVSAVEITDFDIIKTLHRARSLYGESMAFITYDHRPAEYDFDLFKEILGFDFRVYHYRDNQGLYDSIDLACREGIKTLVATGACIVNKVKAWNVNGIFVASGKAPVYEAFANAIRMAELRRENRHFINRLGSILNSISDGVLALDEAGKVFFCNPLAERLLGIKSREVLGKKVDVLLKHEALRKIYRDGQRANGDLVRLDAGKELLVNRVTFNVGGGQCLVINFQVVSAIVQMEEKIRQELYAKGLVAKYSFSDICGDSRLIRETIDQARKFARSHSTVLISGESGTGKELFAQSMHNESDRRNGPFVAVNCAALPETLLESELFGYEEGAFTGARRGGKRGLFEIAHGGTIFLDEIGELGPQLQARILRVIQQKEVMRVGGGRVIPVDVRIITATNRNLFEAVQKGSFREDLFYRLNVLPLKVPPLRRRPEDIPVLFNHFLRRRGDKRVPSQFPQHVTEKMKRYSWPGNVRELENFAERYCALGEDDFEYFSTLRGLISRLFGEDGGERPTKHRIVVELGTFDQIESQIIEQLACLFPNSKGDLAKVLGISRTTLWRKLKASGVQIN